MPSPCEAVRATSATTAGIQRGVPESNQTGNPGVALRQDDAAASGTRDRKWAHVSPPEHDEEKGKERGKHWLWEGAQSSRAAPRERAIHSDRFNGQCTSRHTASLLTDGHGTAAVNRTSPPHSRRETEVPPGGSNGFAPACGCRRGGGFFVGQLGPAENSHAWNLERHHLAMVEIVKLSSRKNSQGRKSVRLKPELVVKVVL